MVSDYDLIVIGGGPGGYVAAIRASQSGMKTAVVEKAELGGVCLNWGCIPTKVLLKSAEQMAFLKEASNWGFTFDKLKFDFARIIQRSRQIAKANSRGVELLMKKNGVRVVKGFGMIVDAKKVVVNDSRGCEVEQMKANHIIIATGGRTRMISGVEADGKRIITSKEALCLKKPPKSMIIIGAGSIGVEFGYFYHTFGTAITIVEMMPQILPTVDSEISATLRRIFEKAGITIFTETLLESVTATNAQVAAKLSGPKGANEIIADCCLLATGVQGNIEGLGLEKIGVQLEKNAIATDSYMRTSVPGIYAIGDVAGEPCLAHVASHEGIVCADKIAGKDIPGMNYSNFPGCTYCKPQVATVGLTEQQAIDKGYDIRVGRYPFTANGKARAIGETEGFVKVIFDAKYSEFLGAHIIGPEATELIAEFCLAKTLECNDEEITHTIHAHPTLSEASMEATLNVFQGAIHI
ncbi:MAG: dihydrolipoyl dehydrogenase [Desulfobacterales bacterium]|nr:MAG: dihydrolipoyl dehydrogenase [Desulfobacterales bacterium]